MYNVRSAGRHNEATVLSLPCVVKNALLLVVRREVEWVMGDGIVWPAIPVHKRVSTRRGISDAIVVVSTRLREDAVCAKRNATGSRLSNGLMDSAAVWVGNATVIWTKGCVLCPLRATIILTVPSRTKCIGTIRVAGAVVQDTVTAPAVPGFPQYIVTLGLVDGAAIWIGTLHGFTWCVETSRTHPLISNKTHTVRGHGARRKIAVFQVLAVVSLHL